MAVPRRSIHKRAPRARNLLNASLLVPALIAAHLTSAKRPLPEPRTSKRQSPRPSIHARQSASRPALHSGCCTLPYLTAPSCHHRVALALTTSPPSPSVSSSRAARPGPLDDPAARDWLRLSFRLASDSRSIPASQPIVARAATAITLPSGSPRRTQARPYSSARPKLQRRIASVARATTSPTPTQSSTEPPTAPPGLLLLEAHNFTPTLDRAVPRRAPSAIPGRQPI